MALSFAKQQRVVGSRTLANERQNRSSFHNFVFLTKHQKMDCMNLLVFLVSRFACSECVVSKLRHCILTQ
jgi:hypothetical protein